MDLPTDKRRELMARAHHLKPVILTGSAGITDALVTEADKAIEHHELIKVRLGGAEREERKAMAAELSKRLRADLIGTVGAVIVLYRKAHPAPTPKVKPKPKAKPRPAAKRR